MYIRTIQFQAILGILERFNYDSDTSIYKAQKKALKRAENVFLWSKLFFTLYIDQKKTLAN